MTMKKYVTFALLLSSLITYTPCGAMQAKNGDTKQMKDFTDQVNNTIAAFKLLMPGFPGVSGVSQSINTLITSFRYTPKGIIGYLNLKTTTIDNNTGSLEIILNWTGFKPTYYLMARDISGKNVIGCGSTNTLTQPITLNYSNFNNLTIMLTGAERIMNRNVKNPIQFDQVKVVTVKPTTPPTPVDPMLPMTTPVRANSVDRPAPTTGILATPPTPAAREPRAEDFQSTPTTRGAKILVDKMPVDPRVQLFIPDKPPIPSTPVDASTLTPVMPIFYASGAVRDNGNPVNAAGVSYILIPTIQDIPLYTSGNDMNELFNINTVMYDAIIIFNDVDNNGNHNNSITTDDLWTLLKGDHNYVNNFDRSTITIINPTSKTSVPLLNYLADKTIPLDSNCFIITSAKKPIFQMQVSKMVSKVNTEIKGPRSSRIETPTTRRMPLDTMPPIPSTPSAQDLQSTPTTGIPTTPPTPVDPMLPMTTTLAEMEVGKNIAKRYIAKDFQSTPTTGMTTTPAEMEGGPNLDRVMRVFIPAKSTLISPKPAQ